MKTITRFLLVTFIAFSFIIANTKKQQKPEWKGKIEYENGVKVIKNPFEPLYGEIEFELEEDLTIGNEGDENYMFFKGISAEVDSDGNIYVLDRGNFRIQKFDKNGNYLQTIGRRGQGPGEFERPVRSCFDSENNIYVEDMRKMHIFDKNGEFKRNISLFDFLTFFGVTKEGNFLAQTRDQVSLVKGTEEVVLVSSQGKKIKTIASFPFENPPPIQKSSIRISLGDIFTPGLFFCHLNEELGIYGYSSEYKLFLINHSGEVIRIIEKEAPKKPFTRKEKNEIVDNYYERNKKSKSPFKLSKSEIKKAFIFPKYESFFSFINKDDKGRIYVSEYIPPFIERKEYLYYDVFNNEGFYIYRIKTKNFSRIIKNGYIYKSEIDPETEYRKIKRYKIKNWDQIKEGI